MTQVATSRSHSVQNLVVTRCSAGDTDRVPLSGPRYQVGGVRIDYAPQMDRGWAGQVVMDVFCNGVLAVALIRLIIF